MNENSLRLDLIDGEARDRAGKTRGKDGPLAAVGIVGEGQPVAQPYGGLKALGEARRAVGTDDQAIDNHLDVVLDLLVQRRRGVDFVKRRRRF